MTQKFDLKTSSLNCWRQFNGLKWQPIPVFLPREYHGQGSLVGCPPWSCTKSDMTEASKHACMHWRRKWKPNPVFLPGESQGQRSLVGSSSCGSKESDTTERLHFHFSLSFIGEGNGNPPQCSCLGQRSLGGCHLWGRRELGTTEATYQQQQLKL